MPTVEYGDWFVWREDPVQIVHGGSGTHHTTTAGHSDVAACLNPDGANRSDFLYQRAFGGPFPSDDPTCAFRSAASRGRSDTVSGVDWPGFCADPAGVFANFATDNNRGSWWRIDNSGRGIFNQQQVNALAEVYGFTFEPWRVPNGYNFFLSDADVLADYYAAAAAAPDGWSVEVETDYPTFVSLEYAPDELISEEAGNSGQVSWLIDTAGDAWSWRDDGWHGGDRPSGTSVAEYSGGESAWQAVPTEWVPELVPDSSVFVVPDDEAAAAVYLTLAHQDIMDGDGISDGEGTSTGAGRFYQTLVFRATWTVPRMRYYRERTTRPSPVRVIGRKNDGLTRSGTQTIRRNTAQRSIRTLGAQR